MASSQPSRNNDTAAKEQKASYLSLPKKGQLAIQCLARITDPLAISSIQSYMFYQLRFFDPSASDAAISTRAGILVGARTAAQVFTGMIWGRLADSDVGGRKGVLFIGLMSCGISYIGYGLAQSFAAIIFWQIFAGLMSNNVAITRCVVAELNPEKRYRTRALLLLPLCASTAQLLGPLIGGLLSVNARDLTGVKYPYLAPNLLLAILYFVAALLVLIFMEETLESLQGTKGGAIQRLFSRQKQRFSKPSTKLNDDRSSQRTSTPSNSNSTTKPSTSETTPLLASDNPPVPPTQPHRQKRPRKLPFRKIWTPNVLCTMLSHFIIAGHLGTFSSLWSIFLTAPTQSHTRDPPFRFSGGLNMLPRDVGFAFALLGAIGMVLQLAVYPLLQDRFGTVKIWRSALYSFPLVYILAPYPSLIASAAPFASQKVWIWLAMSGVLLLYTLGRTGVTPATTLLINDCTPHPSVRGTIHAAATVLGHLSRSIFPVAALTVFGQGLRVGVVGMGFWCLAVLAVASCVASRWVVEGGNGTEIELDESSGEEEERAENGHERRDERHQATS